LSRRAILLAAMRSLLALAAWIAFVYRAWPIRKGMSSLAHRSASQYQPNMHSAPTTSARKGAVAARKASGRQGRLLSRATVPWAPRTHRCMVLACRSIPAYHLCGRS
jgi:hypothetical protein